MLELVKMLHHENTYENKSTVVVVVVVVVALMDTIAFLMNLQRPFVTFCHNAI
jgi:hypothetical protein